MFDKFQSFVKENGIIMGVVALVLAVLIVLLFPVIAYGIGYVSGIVCNAMFGYLFPFEKVPETFGLVAALGCVFSIGSLGGSKS